MAIIKKANEIGCDILKIILASASERRQELLKRIVDDFNVVVSDFDEDKVEFKGNISEYVKDIAYGKALDVSKKVTNDDVIIIAADTVVSIDDNILGKPTSKEDAFIMLNMLSGRTHIVYSSIVMINKSNNNILKSLLSTEVTFSELSKEDITDYIDSSEPFDKAGAYGIQGKGGVFVKKIKGCYYNVVGLSLNKVHDMLKEIM